MTEIWLAFLAGVAGSAHCIGMCGGIVAALSMTTRASPPRSRALSLMFYNLGRISTYTLLGIAAGMIGSALNLPAVRSVSVWFFGAANVFVIAIGLASALGAAWGNLNSIESSSARLFAGPLRKAISGASPFSFFPAGMLLGFLPCGIIYGPLAVAASSASPLRSGAIMAALGLGTAPLLLIFGSASAAISSTIRNLMFRFLGVVIMCMGCAGLWRLLAKQGLAPLFPFW